MSAAPAAQTPPVAPMLRIEVEQHTAVITRLDRDAAERYLVTGSHDKTARVWTLPEGRLLQVLRPPTGPGDEGKVYAVAISPDGATVALGGWTSPSGTDEVVYLFDRESGRLLRRLAGLERGVACLAFSPGGAHLAAVLRGGHGLRVWETRAWQEVYADRDYGADSYGCTFDPGGRLATTCFDGFVRLYAPRQTGRDWQLLHKTRAPGGELPFAIAFSPDGTRLALGYVDTTAVSVLSGADLALLFSPDTAGIHNGNLGRVAWSADGRFLCAGGRYRDGSSVYPILRWAAAGRGERTALAAAQNTVMDLKPWGEAGVLFAAYDPRFGGYDGAGAQALERGPETADLRGKRGAAFTVSADGRALRLGLGVGEAQPVRFDLHQRQLTTEAPADAALAPARTEAEGLAIAGWVNTTAPRLNGTPLALQQYETARSLAITPDGGRFLLGADWSLRLFDRQGAALWQQAVPGVAWGVHLPADGTLALAAYSDGTVRWHRLEDGAELLALFIHPDGRRWVAWTPESYYDASAGADGLIGWQVNNGPEAAADFFPVWQFRERYYRPDVVRHVLDTRDITEALRLADEAAGRPPTPAAEAAVTRSLPPVIELLAPHDGAPFDQAQLTLTYQLRQAIGAVTETSVLIDGRPQPVSPRNVLRATDAEVCQVTLQAPPRDMSLALAIRAGDLEGRSATIRLRWRGETPEPKPTLYLLAVGVSTYEKYKPLTYAHQDAEDFAAAMRKQQGLLYEQVSLRTLPNAEATRVEIIDGLEWLIRTPTSRDIAMVFFAGHGLSDERGKYYFLPYDFDLTRRLATGVKQSDLTEALRAIPARKVLFFVDSCHAGGASDTHFRGAASADIDGLVNALKTASGVIIFASSTGTQLSQEHKDWENGAFTEALLEGLAGKADPYGQKSITVKGLDFYVATRVKALTGGAQTPTTTMPEATPDFPIAALP